MPDDITQTARNILRVLLNFSKKFGRILTFNGGVPSGGGYLKMFTFFFFFFPVPSHFGDTYFRTEITLNPV